MPESVRAVIGRRLAPLSADAVLVLAAATVMGREFDLLLVDAACELPVERVLGGLSEAVALGVVTEEDGAVGVYRFSHSLIREVLYERLPIPARMQLHRRVGEAIKRQLGSGLGSRVAEVAHHFAQVAGAGGAAKVLAYARRAGERAMGMHAYEEAAAQYRRALEALKFAGSDEAVRCELLLRLGAAQARAGRYREVEESCLEAAELSRRLGLRGRFTTVGACGRRSARRPDAETLAGCRRGVRSGPSGVGWPAAKPGTAPPSSGAGPAGCWTPPHAGRSAGKSRGGAAAAGSPGSRSPCRRGAWPGAAVADRGVPAAR
jgi:predicted ATPase